MFARHRDSLFLTDCQPSLMLAVTIVAIWMTSPANAITIRHDVPESAYISLSEDPRYGAAGLMKADSFCSTSGATLIHPEWLLGAAHCTPPQLNRDMQFYLGPNAAEATRQVAADNWFRHPSYTGDLLAGNDFSLMHLSEPILDVTPVRLYRGSSERTNNMTIVGYGRSGTGLTGDVSAAGTKRAGENRVDVANATMRIDFDNPDNPADSTLGPSTPLPLEFGVAFFDSGSPWFMEFDGLTYLIGVTSYEASVDGNANSDYGDQGGASRVSLQTTWIDANHDRTMFWDGSTGNWDVDAKWVAGPQPGAANAGVIDRGHATVAAGAPQAKFVFVEGTGTLELANTLTANALVLRATGTLAVNGAVTLDAELPVAQGTQAFDIRGTGQGSDYDYLAITGTAELAGTLAIQVNEGGGSYADPDVRGTFDEFVLLSALDINGAFEVVDYEGDLLDAGANYVGTNGSGEDGLFRILTHDYVDNQVEIVNYLALEGDANGDFAVDGQDFIIWNSNKFQSGKDWATGDFNGDGVADGQDFIIWNANKFTSVTPPASLLAVPEPGPLTLLLATLCFAAMRRRRLAVGWPAAEGARRLLI